MLLGYIRFSLDDDDTARQQAALLDAGCVMVLREPASTAKHATPERDRMLAQITAGDIIVVASLYQLARSTTELLDVAHRLKDLGGELRSLEETWADTTAQSGWMVFTVLAGMAQFERSLSARRTTTGRVEAKMRGVRFGRPPSLAAEQVSRGRELVEQGTSVRRAAAQLGCHYASLYRALAPKETEAG